MIHRFGEESAGIGPARVLVAVAGDDAGADDARAAAAAAGLRLAALVDFDGAEARLELQVTMDVLMVDVARAPDPLFDRLLDAADRAARETDARIVLCIGDHQIDAAAARLFGPHVQLLCAPSLTERITALAVAAKVENGVVNDATREAEAERLRRMNEEVARIAETLARLTRSAETTAPTLNDRGLSFTMQPADGDEPPVSSGMLRDMIRWRRLRDQFFEPALFADPAWDMLLDLFAAEIEHVRVSVSSLCIAAAVPATTALRWITTMSEAGLFDRVPDPFDRRRAYIVLTAKARVAMRRYFRVAAQAGMPVG